MNEKEKIIIIGYNIFFLGTLGWHNSHQRATVEWTTTGAHSHPCQCFGTENGSQIKQQVIYSKVIKFIQEKMSDLIYPLKTSYITTAQMKQRTNLTHGRLENSWERNWLDKKSCVTRISRWPTTKCMEQYGLGKVKYFHRVFWMHDRTENVLSVVKLVVIINNV